MEENFNKELPMDKFQLVLAEAEELEEIESPWYLVVGGKAALIVVAPIS